MLKKIVVVVGFLGVLLGGLIAGLARAYRSYNGYIFETDSFGFSFSNGVTIFGTVGLLIVIPSFILAVIGLIALSRGDVSENPNRYALRTYLGVYLVMFSLAMASLTVSSLVDSYISSFSGMLGLPIFPMFVLSIFILFGIFFHLKLLLNLWSAINDGKTAIKPGLVIALLFIPVINIFWVGIVWFMYPGAYKKFIARHNFDVPQISSAPFILYGILLILQVTAVLFPFVLPLVMWKGYTAINNLSDQMYKRGVDLNQLRARNSVGINATPQPSM